VARAKEVAGVGFKVQESMRQRQRQREVMGTAKAGRLVRFEPRWDGNKIVMDEGRQTNPAAAEGIHVSEVPTQCLSAV
jgi:hypothetical protein